MSERDECVPFDDEPSVRRWRRNAGGCRCGGDMPGICPGPQSCPMERHKSLCLCCEDVEVEPGEDFCAECGANLDNFLLRRTLRP